MRDRHHEGPAREHSTRDPNDNGSQFYICIADNSGLDRTYTVFGEVFRGIEVVDKIVAAARDDCDSPLEPMTMKECTWNGTQADPLLSKRARSRINKATLEKEVEDRYSTN